MPEADAKNNQQTTRREKPLQSWKEIAAYLDRDESTARRWESSICPMGHAVRDLAPVCGESFSP